MIDVKTPLSKLTRVSRKIDKDAFVATPGIWIEIVNDGSAENITTSTPSVNAKLCIGNASSNKYESHDIEVGRITTLEGAFRYDVDTDGYTGTPAIGEEFIVDDTASSEGKLIALPAAAGTYTIVARCEGFNATTAVATFETVSARTIVVT